MSSVASTRGSNRSYASGTRSDVLPLSQESNKRKRGCCCTWTCILLLVVLLAVAGVLIWRFGPVNKATQLFPTQNPVPGPSSPPPSSAPTYQFNQCSTITDCCNGLDSICDLGVTEVLFAGTHNSYASRDVGFLSLLGNHFIGIKSQLAAGYRGINLDMCNCQGNTVMCHGTCAVHRDPVPVFEEMVDFLNNNPSEIIHVTLELNSNAGGTVVLDDVYTLMQSANGFVDYLYVHTNMADSWPTLREMRDSGKRMVLFHYNGLDCTDGTCPDGLHFYWSVGLETPFSFATVQDVGNYTESCAAGRGQGGTRAFFGVNRFTDIPNADRAKELGTADSLKAHIDACTQQQAQPVNILYVDFWSLTDLVQVTQEHNDALGRRRMQEAAETE